MKWELQVKVSDPAGVPLVSRMSPVVIKLLLTGGQQHENDIKKAAE